ncbi:sulfatase [Pedobacter miscanthi]|uniref:Aryl-sulfate sulfohydrolase n=1 Tax=Pedobacter miscanthi TaxID=2259170 RepID=A0A366KN24_9SPHI|nr:sulfatase [Pedobacter miscanthi]RBQ03081.1 aryl-sulfate sulfohydrolase [Pedobacter miscanthi]
MRYFFKLLLFVFIFLRYLNAHSQSTQLPASKPNILLVFADDLGYMDCGFTGSKIMETPNIDALSKKGMVFNNAYAGAGNCAPSRAALISGLYSPRTGVYAVGSTTRGPVGLMKLVPVRNNVSLNPSFNTIAEGLKGQGYATAIFGKWHLADSKETQPEAQGFDLYKEGQKEQSAKGSNEAADPKGVSYLTETAVKFMQQTKDRPFFVYLAHNAIHSKLEAKAETIAKFKKKGLTDKLALYAACTYDFDASLGVILDFLKKSGLEKNTLVIFTSDNGATQQSSQEPLRGNKGSYYEGGIREPFIAYWPGHIKPGAVNSTPIINLDFYPTFMSLAGDHHFKGDGEDLMPLLLGQQTETIRKSIYWYFPGYLDNPVIRGRDKVFRTRPVAVVRKGDFKLHLYLEEWILDGGKDKINENNAVELYNIKTDDGERLNLAGTNLAKRDELLADLLSWMEKTKAPLPTKITATNKPVQGTVGGEN